MPKPEPRPATKREPGRGHAPDQGIVRDERGQGSRGTRRVLSKSAERIRSGDESRKTAHCGSRRAILHIEILGSHHDPHLAASVPEKREAEAPERAQAQEHALREATQNR